VLILLERVNDAQRMAVRSLKEMQASDPRHKKRKRGGADASGEAGEGADLCVLAATWGVEVFCAKWVVKALVVCGACSVLVGWCWLLCWLLCCYVLVYDVAEGYDSSGDASAWTFPLCLAHVTAYYKLIEPFVLFLTWLF
jgi:hypothetical protein